MSIREDLKAFIDGELNAQRAEEVRLAIEQDPQLLEEVDFMKSLSQSIREAEKPVEVQGYDGVAAKLQSRGFWGAWGRRTLAVTGAIAGVMFLGLVGRWFLDGSSAGDDATKTVASKAADSTKVGMMPERYDGVAVPPGYGSASKSAAPDAKAESGANAAKRTRMEGGALADRSAPPVASPPSDTSWRNTQNRNSITTNTVLPDAERQIIRQATLDLRVDDAGKALEAAKSLVKSVGGYYQSDNFSNNNGIAKASVILKVPQKLFDDVMGKLRQLGEVVNDNSTSDDVTAQVADVEARLKVMRAEEDQYVTLLRGAKSLGQIMEVRERINQIRQEIESLDAQRKRLSALAALSTVNVTFEQRSLTPSSQKPETWMQETWATSVNALKFCGRLLMQGLIVVFVLSPLWLPVLGIAWWLTRRGKRPS